MSGHFLPQNTAGRCPPGRCLKSLTHQGQKKFSQAPVFFRCVHSASISRQPNRKQHRARNKNHHKACRPIENIFQNMRVFRRAATRYDKPNKRFPGCVPIVGIMKWLH